MTAEFEEVIGGEQGRGTGSKVDDTEFGLEMATEFLNAVRVRPWFF